MRFGGRRTSGNVESLRGQRDLQEGMGAAAAIGDDTLQRSTQGFVVSESFTHGTAEQRQEALLRGFRGGSLEACAVYTSGI